MVRNNGFMDFEIEFIKITLINSINYISIRHIFMKNKRITEENQGMKKNLNENSR